MTTSLLSSIVWGHATLLFERAPVVEGYLNGRQYYFESCAEEPRRVSMLTATDLLWLVATPDADGSFQVDSDLQLEEQLGFVLGYLSGPLAPDPVAEAKARQDYRELGEPELSQQSVQAPSLSWGRVTLSLDHEAFCEGYQDGRECYFEACLYDTDSWAGGSSAKLILVANL